MGYLIDEKNSLVSLMDCAGNNPLVRRGAKLRMPPVRIVPHISKQFRLACTSCHNKWVSVYGHYYLIGLPLLHGPPLLQGLLIKNSYLLTVSLVNHHLFLAVLVNRGGNPWWQRGYSEGGTYGSKEVCEGANCGVCNLWSSAFWAYGLGG